jgi:PEGA domain
MLAGTLHFPRVGAVTLGAICFVALGGSSRANAGVAKQPAVLAVRGQGLDQEKAIAVKAVTAAMTRAGWALTPRSFTSQEAEELVKCLPVEQPWPCLAKAVRDSAVRRLAVLSLESQPTADGTPMTVVTVQIASADQQDSAHGGRRYCQPCSPDSLAKLTTAAAEDVIERMYLRSGKTFLEVKSEPLGAIISVNGKRKGVTNAAFPVLPGSQRIDIVHPQYESETRTVEAEEDKTTVVTVAFSKRRAAGSSPVPRPTNQVRPPSAPLPSGVLPGALLAGGGLLIAGGAIAFLSDEDDASRAPHPETPQSQSFYNTAPLGVGLIVAGVAVAGVGGWLLWRSSSNTKPQGMAATSLLVYPGGGAISYSSPF